jgi:PKHD-type hydroxylase
MYDRKISIIIQLTDPSEYEGGEFEMDYQYEQPNKEDLKKKGTIIVFPSFIPHRVTELTKGTRKSLVAWVEGPKFV